MTAPIFVPPKTRAVAHKDQNKYVIWNPSICWKRTRVFSWSTGICVKKVFCIIEKLLVVCFLIVGDFCVLSVNSMSIYLSSWPYRWNTFTQLHFTRICYIDSAFIRTRILGIEKEALRRYFPRSAYHFISLPFFFH